MFYAKLLTISGFVSLMIMLICLAWNSRAGLVKASIFASSFIFSVCQFVPLIWLFDHFLIRKTSSLGNQPRDFDISSTFYHPTKGQNKEKPTKPPWQSNKTPKPHVNRATKTKTKAKLRSSKPPPSRRGRSLGEDPTCGAHAASGDAARFRGPEASRAAKRIGVGCGV